MLLNYVVSEPRFVGAFYIGRVDKKRLEIVRQQHEIHHQATCVAIPHVHDKSKAPIPDPPKTPVDVPMQTISPTIR